MVQHLHFRIPEFPLIQERTCSLLPTMDISSDMITNCSSIQFPSFFCANGVIPQCGAPPVVNWFRTQLSRPSYWSYKPPYLSLGHLEVRDRKMEWGFGKTKWCVGLEGIQTVTKMLRGVLPGRQGETISVGTCHVEGCIKFYNLPQISGSIRITISNSHGKENISDTINHVSPFLLNKHIYFWLTNIFKLWLH